MVTWRQGLCILGCVLAQEAAAQDVPSYVGSAACAACHQAETAAWSASHHAAAWTLPGTDTVLGDFGNTAFDHQGVTHRFYRDGGTYMIETDGPEGRAAYPIAGVAGIAPLQQYLVETEPGRIQSHDVVWDIEGERWYHLYPDQILSPEDGLHWTGVYKTWNARCADCHATGYEKRYDARVRGYDSREAEIGVGCEACHGPGSAHIAWTGGEKPLDGLTGKGFTIGFTRDLAETEIQQCAGCHSRREALLDGNPLPGTPFADAYRLSLLRDGLYHADGTIRDEVYVYGSFLQSRMYAKGVRCSDCHDPHAADR
ncbi:MAG: multiheme c-type cytochrome, partial [Pseudomonadota bacterium]